MKLLDGGRAPNPRRVRIFLAEKGIEVPLEPVDMGALDHKGERVTKANGLQRLPVLELADGTAIAESVAICRYFEELHPDPPLMGRDPLDCAMVEMWQRRMELHFLMAVALVFRHAHPAMAEWEKPQITELSESQRPKVIQFLSWFDKDLGDRPFAAGEHYSIADITATVALDFMKPARLAVPEELNNVNRYYAAMRDRSSYGA
jgi:glutathione S-transferase